MLTYAKSYFACKMLYRRLTILITRLNKNNFINTLKYSTLSAEKEKIIKIDNYCVNYLKVGNGPSNVLLVPGSFGTIWTDFKPQLEGFDREKFTLLAFDPPGYGKSRPPNKTFTGNYYEEDAIVLNKLVKILNIRRYSILGWSGGAITSMIYAAHYPDVVDKLVIWGGISRILPRENEAYKHNRFNLNNWSDQMRKQMIEIYGDQLDDYVKTWVNGLIAIAERNNGNICTELLKDIKCPTFILSGGKDPIIDSSQPLYLHANIAGSRLHSYPEGKHNIHIKYSEDFNERVQQFLLE